MDDIKKIEITDAGYPEELRKTKGAPKTIYYKGILPSNDEKCIAVVGTRRYSPYGQQTALKMAGELAEAGMTVVSGLAPGIDTFCHQAVVDKKKRTIAVIGTGLDEKSIYPQINIDLSRKIVANGGCLISELPEGTPGSKFSFPRRNRIVSGLSLAVLVIEAKEKSGSLITADYAVKQNKKLFAVPGSIYSLNSAGPNKLIKNGAKLITDVTDILNEFGLLQMELLQNDVKPENREEELVLEALRGEPLHVDKIIEKTKLTASVIATTIALMEISGKIRSLRANTYSLN